VEEAVNFLLDKHKQFPYCPECESPYSSLKMVREKDGRIFVKCSTVSKYGGWKVPCFFDFYADSVEEAEETVRRKWKEKEER